MMNDAEARALGEKYGVRVEFAELPEGTDWAALDGLVMCRSGISAWRLGAGIEQALKMRSSQPSTPASRDVVS